jgi:hypothetical protein
MIKLKKTILGCLSVLFFIVIAIVFSLFDAGLKWENLSQNYILVDHLTLILFRILTYGLPALLIALVNKSKRFRLDLRIVDYYSIQFIAYTIVKMSWDILSLGYIWSIDILDHISTSVVVVSLVLTLILNKKTKVNADLI